MWTHNVTDCLIVELNTRIALASMTYITHEDDYELHMGDETTFNNFSDEC